MRREDNTQTRDALVPTDMVALVRLHASQAGLMPGDWLDRAVRAYAKAPASAAERMRASRARNRLAKAGETDPVTPGGAE